MTPVQKAFNEWLDSKDAKPLINAHVTPDKAFAIFVAGWQARPLVAPVMQPHAKP